MEETRSGGTDQARRSLAAIMITDAAGFSALASRDENRALDLLQMDMAVFRAACARFGGKVIKSTGDGLLMSFDSAVEAVNCALDIQTAMAVRSGEHLFQHRIGVHLGDVVLTVDDAYGDGVNVASRLQTGAKPGSVWISQTVFDVIRGKVGCRCVFEGDKTFKGLATRIPVWSVVPGEGVVGAPKRHAPRWALVAAPVMLVAAIALAVASANMQNQARQDREEAQKEKANIVQLLQTANGGTLARNMDFGGMRQVLVRNLSPNDPQLKEWLPRLDGMEQWKGWLQTRLDQSSELKPVKVAPKTAGTPAKAVYRDKAKGLVVKEGDKVTPVKLEDLDPETLTALTDSFSAKENASFRRNMQKWVKDLRTISFVNVGHPRLPGKTPPVPGVTRIQVGRTGGTDGGPGVKPPSDIQKKIDAALDEARKEMEDSGGTPPKPGSGTPGTPAQDAGKSKTGTGG